LARARCAFEGGLNEESRTNRVFGDGGFDEEGLILRTMRNLESDDWKDLRAVSSCGKMLRKELVVVLMMVDATYRSILGITQRSTAERVSLSYEIQLNLDQDRKLIWVEIDRYNVVLVGARVK
jgi:hypothetical protein